MHPPTQEPAHCDICGSSNLSPFSAKEWMFKTKEEFSYAQCNQCECIQLLTKIDDFSKYYPPNYHSFGKDLDTRFSTPRFQKDLRLLKTRFFENSPLPKGYETLDLIRKLGIDKHTRIVDIGCGNGELLYFLRELGFKNTTGFDPFINSDIEYRNGLQIKKCSVYEIQSQFDLVMLNHSFEHMREPLKVLQQAESIFSNDSGRLLILIPVVNEAWSLFREYWYQIDPPRHLYLYSVKGLHTLLEKVGLQLEKTIFDSTPAQILLSEKTYYQFNQKDLNYYLIRLCKPIRKMVLKKRVDGWNQMGLGDQAAFLITRKSKAVPFGGERG
jgi:SAM-dependent methyltransferase